MVQHTAHHASTASVDGPSAQANSATSNTGVLRASFAASAASPSSCTWHPDYFVYSCPEGTRWPDVLPFTSKLEWHGEPSNFGGYTWRRSALGVEVYFNDLPAIGDRPATRYCFSDRLEGRFNVRISASAMACLMAYRLVKDWQEFASWVMQKGYRFTRVDIAIDDKAGLIQRGQVLDCLANHHLTSRFRQYGNVRRARIGQELGDNGETIYIGSKTSDAKTWFNGT